MGAVLLLLLLLDPEEKPRGSIEVNFLLPSFARVRREGGKLSSSFPTCVQMRGVCDVFGGFTCDGVL